MPRVGLGSDGLLTTNRIDSRRRSAATYQLQTVRREAWCGHGGAGSARRRGVLCRCSLLLRALVACAAARCVGRCVAVVRIGARGGGGEFMYVVQGSTSPRARAAVSMARVDRIAKWFLYWRQATHDFKHIRCTSPIDACRSKRFPSYTHTND